MKPSEEMDLAAGQAWLELMSSASLAGQVLAEKPEEIEKMKAIFFNGFAEGVIWAFSVSGRLRAERKPQ